MTARPAYAMAAVKSVSTRSGNTPLNDTSPYIYNVSKYSRLAATPRGQLRITVPRTCLPGIICDRPTISEGVASGCSRQCPPGTGVLATEFWYISLPPIRPRTCQQSMVDGYRYGFRVVNKKEPNEQYPNYCNKNVTNIFCIWKTLHIFAVDIINI